MVTATMAAAEVEAEVIVNILPAIVAIDIEPFPFPPALPARLKPFLPMADFSSKEAI